VNLQQAIDAFLPQIEDEMRACMAAPDKSAPAFYGMLHYHVGWTDVQFQPVRNKTGKRVRPLMTLLCCQAVGGAPSQALPAAAAVEIIHNFSLVHDDIQDRSATRRGRRTVWAVWGDAQAINAGDAMFTLAHLALQRLAHCGVSARRVVAALNVLDNACLRLCEGQHLDIAFENRLDVDVASYMRMIGGKTAALLGCAARLGAMVATDDVTIADRYRRIGEALGMAFQIQDDVLGIWGQAGVTGKPVADDIRSRKKTLPVLFLLCQPDVPGAGRMRALYGRDSLSEQDVTEAVALLDAAGAESYAEQLARRYLREALAELEAACAEPQAGEALRELAHFLVQRAS
jgi:geranylgeranyl diphosphate synthase, type I